ncbi:MAG TPA: trypsin-like serine protease [Polyangiaceae bacterium]|nr:trypsin-like serine protease [Polyangiaceae bacterium]
MKYIHRVCVLGGLVGLLSGCSMQAADGSTPLSSTQQRIVDGVPTSGPSLNAIGGIVFKYAPAHIYDFSCTGTLIAPKVVLTARHCVVGDPGWHFFPLPSFNNFVVFGNNVDRPAQKVKIKGYMTAPAGNAGLLGGGGRDIAVLYLDHAPSGITPAQLGHFDPGMLGTQFRIAGFGQTENFTVGTKLEGLATARALSGDWYPLLFNNSFAAFDEWYWTDASLATPSEAEEAAWWAPGPSCSSPVTSSSLAGYPVKPSVAGGIRAAPSSSALRPRTSPSTA